jgi:hypothetical protein
MIARPAAPPPLPALEPLDAAAGELAAELGAPALPPLAAHDGNGEGSAPAAGAPERAPGRGRRRRRRRRGGRWARPDGGAAAPQG